jgi:UPF0755 protein
MRRDRMKRWLAGLLVIAVAVLALMAGALWWLNRPMPLARDSAELAIELGTSPREIAQGWVDAGAEVSPTLLYEWFRWSGQARKIRAGSYEIERGTTPVSLLNKLVRGDETMAVVRLIDGWTFRQFRAELAKADSLKPTIATLTDAQVMDLLGDASGTPEGRFYPDTYAYSKGTTDIAVLRRAHHAMQQRLALAWAERAPDTPLKSPEELLTLASIVEKETGTAADRAKVAAVFVNRLRVGMPLQTDPTVIYGLGTAFDGNLRKKDLQTDGPYNTYLRAGLPPTPISMPGKAALMATVRPEPIKSLFFVSRGDGSSEFSESLADHNRAVNKYQRNK